MSRTTTTTTDTNTAKDITKPVWLLQLKFGSTPGTWLHFSDGPTVSLEGNTYSRKGLKVHRCNDEQASFTLTDYDLVIWAFIGIYGANDRPIKLWLHYETDATLLFDGFTDGQRSQGRERRFEALRYPAGMGSWPDRIYTRAEYPNLPRAGQKIRWRQLALTLEPRR